jgi:uncharacterized membrane protein (UPF0127 family)
MILSSRKIKRIIVEELERALPRCKSRKIKILDNEIDVEVADTDFLRRRGLMNRSSLDDGKGMLFVFPDKSIQGFWMKNTYIPLSIAFIEDDGTISSIENMSPNDSESKLSKIPVRYALEVPSGWFDRNGLGPGYRVENLVNEDTNIDEQLRLLRKGHTGWQGWTSGIFEEPEEQEEQEDEKSPIDELESILG